jgi:hypothetical protein
MGIPCKWPCKAYEINVAGLTVESLTIENYLVIATARIGHYRVVPRKDNKLEFWLNVFELRKKGNLTSKTLKNFHWETKTFYDSISYNNFHFTKEIIQHGSEEVQIFTQISEN